MEKVTILHKHFKKFISSQTIQEKVSGIAERINRDFEGKEVVFVGILNGVFIFVADLFRQVNLKARITFLRLASYHGMESTGKVKQLIGLSEDLKNHIVIVVEDIVDTGTTLDHIIRQLQSFQPAEIHVVTLLLKPEAYHHRIPIDYVGMEIPNKYIIGYGLDYNGYGRNLDGIYVLDENNES
ncbi:MAG TPA: hypoxanthine phosphoribosyltransferase [Bacteroidetes bacterium]|nr:hypoxanthine phosphoribosyltransferase [Bacteroidota bacterium]